MVKARTLLLTPVVVFGLILISSAQAQIQFHLNHESAEIWINQDGTIDLLYNISVTCDSGTIHWVEVGQPNSDFTIGPASDKSGNPLTATDTGHTTVRVALYTPISSGQTIELSLFTNVGQMVWEDTTPQNTGNVGMEFIPAWYDATISDLQVLIILPPNVSQLQVKTMVDWNGTQIVDGRSAIYWERHNLAPNQKYTFGVSFPKEYVQKYYTRPTGIVAFFQQYGAVLALVAVVVAVVGGVAIMVRKRPYLIPTMGIETLGARRGLTAVEASYILDLKPQQIVTEILYSLLKKKAVWVESITPAVTLRIMDPFRNKTGTTERPLRYYEIDFLNAVREDGTLDEEALAQTVTFLEESVEEKLRGYCRRDTIDYYRKVVERAWEQVEQAGTPELASKAYDSRVLWLLLDPGYKSRTETAFRERVVDPSPMWLWYWYGYQHYQPRQSYRPTPDNPTQAGKPPTVPGAEFANNIASAVEGTANNIVVNLEKFANAITPFPAAERASHQPAHHEANCVCACAACACACACVSCACACAGGGVG